MRMLQTLRFRLRSAPGMVLTAAVAGLIVAPEAILLAQEPPPAPASSEQAAPEQAATLSQDQLESLVAPIALYPDPLLSQCLVASTYPLDIMEAQQWLSKNPDLKGDALTEAAKKQDWDPSIQAMVALPDVMKRMSENIKWTTDLGNAFLAQENDVMNAVQALRVKAKDSGKLESTDQMKVETKTIETKTIVEIQPASTQVVYVPSYSPTVIWGPPVYPYPPVYYPPYVPGAALFSFGMGMAVGAAISGGWGWGCGWGGNNTININNNNTFVNNSNRTNNINRSGNSNWQHNGDRRGGVPYQDRATANKYGGGARGDSASARQQQARSREGAGAANRSAGQGNPGASRGGTSPSASSFDRGGSGGGGAGNYAGGRDMSSRGSGGGSAFSGSSGSHARSSSSRGASSMGGGGMSRGGGGRRR